jgi:hypothetical protein
MRRIVAARARAATLDFARAYRPGVSTAGEARELWASRVESWLSDVELRAANRHLSALIRLLSASSRASDAKRRRYSLTFALAPSRLKSARKERVERRG